MSSDIVINANVHFQSIHLIRFGEACKELGLSSNEFVQRAVHDLIDETLKGKNNDVQ